MSEEEDATKRAEQLHAESAAIYEHMGRLASDWALLEFMVDDCIWRLADVNATLGACITAQIFTINNRLMALMSLMRLRGFPEKPFVKEVNDFAEAVRGPAEKRNRVVHDPIFVSQETGEIARLQITAQRHPVAGMKTITQASLLSDREAVYKAQQDFVLKLERPVTVANAPPLSCESLAAFAARRQIRADA